MTIHAANETEAEVLVCPRCSSTQVAEGLPPVSLGIYRCATCNSEWSREDLIVSRFKHELGDDSDILQQLVRSLRNTVAKDLASSMGRFLLRWGFINAPEPYVLSRYVNACAKTMLISVIEERQKIERETHAN